MTINGDIIEQVEEFNFLGITVDQNVNWDAHITKISIKLARVIGILQKLKRTFPQHILRTIYNSLIHPIFDGTYANQCKKKINTISTDGLSDSIKGLLCNYTSQSKHLINLLLKPF